MLVGGSAGASTIETLLMPGKVTSAHAKIESECASCHDRSNRTSQNTLCMSCHKDIAADVTAQKGYHGRVAALSDVQCHGCHTEHQGRDADIVKLVPELFNHKLTEFPLVEAHATLACGSCRLAGKNSAKRPSAVWRVTKKMTLIKASSVQIAAPATTRPLGSMQSLITRRQNFH